jgi:hypothetical protein
MRASYANPCTSRRVGVVVAIAATLALSLVLAGAAMAFSTYHWWNGGSVNASTGRVAAESRSNIIGSYSHDTSQCECHVIGAGLNQTGTYATGAGEAYHSYTSNPTDRGTNFNFNGTLAITMNSHVNYN